MRIKTSIKLLFPALIVIFGAIPTRSQDLPDASKETFDIQKGRAYSPYANRGFPTQVYFGDTHVHTSISADAGGVEPARNLETPTDLLAASRLFQILDSQLNFNAHSIFI